MKNGRLGKLEFVIMDYVWKQDRHITVPEVHEQLLKKRNLAYTSTMTVMSRLAEKGLLKRNQDRRPYTYWPAVSREDYSAELMLGVLSELGNRKAALARFVERIGRKDAETLRGLILEARTRRK